MPSSNHHFFRWFLGNGTTSSHIINKIHIGYSPPSCFWCAGQPTFGVLDNQRLVCWTTNGQDVLILIKKIVEPHLLLWFGATVDSWNPASIEVGSLSHCLQGFIHPRWWSPDFWTINSILRYANMPNSYSSLNLPHLPLSHLAFLELIHCHQFGPGRELI